MTVGPNKSGESYGGNRCLNTNDYIIKPFKGNVRSTTLLGSDSEHTSHAIREEFARKYA